MTGLTYETLKVRNQVHQVKEELKQELSKENGKDDTKLRNFALELPRTRRLPRGASQTCGTLTRSGRQEAHGGWTVVWRVRDSTVQAQTGAFPITKRSEHWSLPGGNGPFRGSSCGTGRATRRWLQPWEGWGSSRSGCWRGISGSSCWCGMPQESSSGSGWCGISGSVRWWEDFLAP